MEIRSKEIDQDLYYYENIELCFIIKPSSAKKKEREEYACEKLEKLKKTN
jgi:hypothetical protein